MQQYYRTTAATASAPAVPTTSTPPSPWTTTEPAYAADTALWVTTRVGYSNGTFSYTPVSKVSAFTAAVMAGGKLTLATSNPTTAQGTGKPAGSLWMVKSGGAWVSLWEWNGTAWASVPLSETIIPQIAIGTGTYGELSGSRLVADSVEATKIAAEEALFDKLFASEFMAGRIQVDHVEPAFGSNLNLTANGDIILLAGRQDELADEIAATSVIATDAADLAEDATVAASLAQAAADIADGKALVAQNRANEAADGLAAQQAVFVVTATGAEVRSVDASNIFQITPTGAAIVQGGDAVSFWDGAQFISNEIVTNRAQLGNHVVEKSGTRTVFRAL